MYRCLQGYLICRVDFFQNSKYVYSMGSDAFVVDSSASNIGGKAPRRYRGADAQLKIKHAWGATELRTEYWWGTQTATSTATETPPL